MTFPACHRVETDPHPTVMRRALSVAGKEHVSMTWAMLEVN